jgi:hypothetical protein
MAGWSASLKSPNSPMKLEKLTPIITATKLFHHVQMAAEQFLSSLPYYVTFLPYCMQREALKSYFERSHPATLVLQRDSASLKGRVPPPTGIIVHPPLTGLSGRHLAPRCVARVSANSWWRLVSVFYYYRHCKTHFTHAFFSKILNFLKATFTGAGFGCHEKSEKSGALSRSSLHSNCGS